MQSAEQLAVISGGTSGIGLATAARLIEDGFHLLILGRDQERGMRAAADLERRGSTRVEFIPHHSEDFAAYERLRDRIGDRKVHAVVASAGTGRQGRLIDTPVDVFDHIMQVNVAGPLQLVQTLRPVLAHPSSVVLISSDASIRGEQDIGAYSVSKAALNMLGKMLALDLAGEGVRVNIVCPGDTVPGMRYLLPPGATERDPDDVLKWPIPPRGRLGEGRDTAELVAFLVSARADFIVGATVLVDGGSRAGQPEPRPSP
jgi:NAD(P)-dependent dehydrogenase (short-subunit alcohol dehydrogenase family)